MPPSWLGVVCACRLLRDYVQRAREVGVLPGDVALLDSRGAVERRLAELDQRRKELQQLEQRGEDEAAEWTAFTAKPGFTYRRRLKELMTWFTEIERAKGGTDELSAFSDLIGVGDGLREWRVHMQGPPATPYADGRFVLTIELGVDYPMFAPTIRFVTKIYHPSIGEDGRCHWPEVPDRHTLWAAARWAPSIPAIHVLLQARSLLAEPLPGPFPLAIYENGEWRRNGGPQWSMEDNPIEVFLRDRARFDATAREWTQRYAAAVQP